jgi:hypothetical protein
LLKKELREEVEATRVSREACSSSLRSRRGVEEGGRFVVEGDGKAVVEGGVYFGYNAELEFLINALRPVVSFVTSLKEGVKLGDSHVGIMFGRAKWKGGSDDVSIAMVRVDEEWVMPNGAGERGTSSLDVGGWVHEVGAVGVGGVSRSHEERLGGGEGIRMG